MRWLSRSAACCQSRFIAATWCSTANASRRGSHLHTNRLPVAGGRAQAAVASSMSSPCPTCPQPQAQGMQAHTIDSSFLNLDNSTWTSTLHLIVLNYHLPDCLALLWPHAHVRMCADGGANRLYDQLPVLLPHMDAATARISHLPDYIRGDMDSVRPDVSSFYSSHNVPMEDLSSDQNTTDLTKCLDFLQRHIRALRSQERPEAASVGTAAAAGSNTTAVDGAHSSANRQQPVQQLSGHHSNPHAVLTSSSGGTSSSSGRGRPCQGQRHMVLVLGALGGRLDHTLSNLNTLYNYPDLDVVLMGEGNLVRLLPRGTSTIMPHPLEGPSCGLVPLAGPAVASSKGLRWDLHDTQMRWRGLLSTSNQIVDPQIVVTTDEELLWITEVHSMLRSSGQRDR